MGAGQGILARGVIWALRGYLHLKAGRVDETEGQPDVHDGVKALHSQDWSKFDALYPRRSPADQYHFLQGVANVSKIEGAWPPTSTRQFAIIAAGLCVGWAWRNRGYGAGSTVTEAGARNMWRLLERGLLARES